MVAVFFVVFVSLDIRLLLLFSNSDQPKALLIQFILKVLGNLHGEVLRDTFLILANLLLAVEEFLLELFVYLSDHFHPQRHIFVFTFQVRIFMPPSLKVVFD